MDKTLGFEVFPLTGGEMFYYDDGKFKTRVNGFTGQTRHLIGRDDTHYGFVVSGAVDIEHGPYKQERTRRLFAGDHFAFHGQIRISSEAPHESSAVIITALGFRGLNVFGGPVEETGRLKYIDGCTDTLLVPPIRKGDPCLNHLHFPPMIVQTAHTHPSVRAGFVFRGKGECVWGEDKKKVPLEPGGVFLLKTGTVHKFDTHDQSMDIIAFHPDTDVGFEDQNHPMLNRTIVDGVSARERPEIQTR